MQESHHEMALQELSCRHSDRGHWKERYGRQWSRNLFSVLPCAPGDLAKDQARRVFTQGRNREIFPQPSGWAVMVKRRFARASVEPQAEVVTAGILVGTVKASRVPKSLCQILPRGCQASTVS